MEADILDCAYSELSTTKGGSTDEEA